MEKISIRVERVGPVSSPAYYKQRGFWNYGTPVLILSQQIVLEESFSPDEEEKVIQAKDPYRGSRIDIRL